MAKVSLGRGFDVLMPKDLDSSILEEDKNRIQKLLIADVFPNPDQPRRDFDNDALEELALSVKKHGVLQPITVVRAGNKYRIVAGERRWRAATKAELQHIPAIVRTLDELEELELSLIENIQRVDLSPLEQALSIHRLQQQFSLALEQISEKLGKAPSTISNITRLLQLPDAARDALAKSKITEGHARAILALKDKPAKQQELLDLIVENGWTVRQAEQFVVATKKGGSAPVAKAKTASETPLTKQLSTKLGTKVTIKNTAKGGQLVIQFKSEEDLQRIAKSLS